MSLTLGEKFKKAYEYVQRQPKDGPFQPDQTRKLQYYKYYKQATEGDVKVQRPGLFDLAGKIKWDAWNSVKGQSREAAEECYVNLLIEDMESIGSTEKILEELRA